MTEPDVALTDFALTVECAILAGLVLQRVPRGAARAWAVAFFFSIGVAALLGGAVHGFFASPDSAAHGVLWKAGMLAIGVTGLACWALGAQLLAGPRGLRRVAAAGAVALPALAFVVLFVSDDFLVAVLAYLPGVVFLLFAFLRRARVAHRVHRARRRSGAGGGAGDRAAIAGLLLTLLAAAGQQQRIALHPVHFTHNAVYHVLQGIALWLVYTGLRDALAREELPHADTT